MALNLAITARAGHFTDSVRKNLAAVAGLEFFFWTYSSCGASGLNFSLALTPVELVLKSGILKETKHISLNCVILRLL